jgi:hypothetical protein
MTTRRLNKMMKISWLSPSSTLQLTGPPSPRARGEGIQESTALARASGEREGAHAPGEGNLGNPS